MGLKHKIAYTRDLDSGAEYIKVSDKDIWETKVLRNGLLVDLDSKGDIVGIEIIHEQLPD